ncbi:extracellular solute-binding protein [Streptomyces sp. NPDC005423]|uniref:extracellular solute-binding protein n=1 Tax=Streptomyces sp. NPDC005423 TaxID=3155343 RepID=UPI0033A643F3
MVRRRRFTAPAAPLLVALLLVAGCGGHPVRQPADDQGSGEIVVASGRDVTGKGGIREQLIDAWNRQQRRKGSRYRARLVELPGNADEQRSQLLGALQSGSADYDVVNLDVTWVPEFAAARLIRPLPAEAVDDDGDVINSVAETARWGGKAYAMPFNSDVGLLYYRPDLLKRAGVQQTDLSRGIDWKQLQTLSGDVSGALPEVKGWTTQLAAYEGRTVNAVEAFASAVPGFKLTDGDGHYDASVRDLTTGIDELRSRTETAYTLPDAFHSDETGSLNDFADGRTEFLRQWPYAYRTLHQSFTSQQLGVAPLPGHAVLGGQNLAVTQSSQRAYMATKLMTYLTDRGSERCLLDAGFAATRVSAYEDDDVTCPVAAAPTPSASSGSATGESADRMPRDPAGRPAYARRILLPALRKAVQRPRTPLYGAFTQTFSAQLGALFGENAPSDAVLAKRLDAALRKALPG